MSDKHNNSIVWSEKREKLGISVSLEVTHDNGVFTLSGVGSGYGAGPFRFSRAVSGDMERNEVIGRHQNADVHLWVRIQNWRATRSYLSFDLTVWGAYGIGPWLPVGGEYFKVAGSVTAFDSAVDLGAFMQDELPILVGALGMAADDPPALRSAPRTGPQLIGIGTDEGSVGGQDLTTLMEVGIPGLIGQSYPETPPGNERVVATWNLAFDRNGLTASGNVKPKRATDHIGPIVTAFTSPDYRPGDGTYHAGAFSAMSEMRDPAGGWAGFILQSQQFDERHRGTVVQAAVAGYVGGALFEFRKLIRIP